MFRIPCIGCITIVIHGCRESDPRGVPSQLDTAQKEFEWAMNNMLEPATTSSTTESTTTTSAGSMTATVSASTISDATVPVPTRTIPDIVNLALRPLSLIRNSYQIYITQAILTDTSRTVFEKYTLFGIPQLVGRYLESPTEELDVVRDMILLVAGELVSGAAEDTSSIIGSLSRVCDHVHAVAPFADARSASVQVADKFRYVLQKLPLANLDLVCPRRIADDVELKYAIFLQKEYRKAILASPPSSAEGFATWTVVEVASLSQVDLLFTGLAFMSLTRPEKLRLGIDFSSTRFSPRLWYDRYTSAIFGRKKFDDEHDLFLNMGGQPAASYRAVGRFLALSLLDMQPLGIAISRPILEILLGKRQNATDFTPFESALFRGFNAVVPATSLSLFDSVELEAIFLGRSPTAWDIVLHLQPPNSELPEMPLVDLCNRAAGSRGVAVGQFGTPLDVFLTIDEDAIEGEETIEPGAKITISRISYDKMF